MDVVRVHLQVRGEPTPSEYVVSGGSFADMKASVKATSATFDGDRKSWLIPGPGAFDVLKQLRQQYTVQEVPLLHSSTSFDEVAADVSRDSVKHTLTWQADTWTVNTKLWLKFDTNSPYWCKLPPVPVTVEITPGDANRHAAQMAATGWTPAQVHGQSIARRIVQEDLERRTAGANERLFALLKGKTRSKEEMLAALATLFTELLAKKEN